jgi:hypothetical protein
VLGRNDGSGAAALPLPLQSDTFFQQVTSLVCVNESLGDLGYSTTQTHISQTCLAHPAGESSGSKDSSHGKCTTKCDRLPETGAKPLLLRKSSRRVI